MSPGKAVLKSAVEDVLALSDSRLNDARNRIVVALTEPLKE